MDITVKTGGWLLRAGLALVVAGFGALAVTAVGCTSSDTNGAQATDGGLVCPNTVDLANGAKCGVENGVCEIGYACGAFEQQAVCTCTGGTFTCNDATGKTVDPGGTFACKPNGSGNDACPASESAADLATCTTAGQQCNYSGLVCPEGNGVANVDTCQCVSNPAGGLYYRCEPVGCLPRGDASDEQFEPVDANEGGSDGGGSDANVDANDDGG